MGYLEDLHATLTERARPEKVARIIASAPSGFTRAERELLARAAGPERASWWYSSMTDDFERVPGAENQLATVYRIFGVPAAGRTADPDDVASILALADQLGSSLLWRNSDVSRLTHPERRAAGIEHSGRRAYKRRVRALHHLAEKAGRMSERLGQRNLIMLGRSGFAHTIPLTRFAADPDAAMFVAYITARKNLRREFTLSGRDNPVDKLAEALLARLGDSSDWEMVALAWPKPGVLERLSAERLGYLAARWMTVMRECAGVLEREWGALDDGGRLDRSVMMVRRGMDSSTWNETAQAYNAARSGWLGCLAATPGSLALVRDLLPGKVMRLMAADLMNWHAGSGGGADPNTAAWGALPLPWEVLGGRATCPESLVRETCRGAGMDPDLTGWTLPLPRGEAAEIRPTPELVHGVTISDPVWAHALRAAGVFAGHGARGRKPSADASDLRRQADQGGVVASELPSRSVLLLGYDEGIAP